MERVKLTANPQLAYRGKATAGVKRGAYDMKLKTPEQKKANKEKDLRRKTFAEERARDRKAGRPTKYLGEVHDELVYDLRLVGCSREQIAQALNITLELLDQWRETHTSFFSAWNAGGDEADAAVARKLFNRAIGYEHPSEKIFYDSKTGEVVRAETTERYAPDTSAAIFWLTNRQGQKWKNRQSSELSGPDGTPLELPQIVINPVQAAPRED